MAVVRLYPTADSGRFKNFTVIGENETDSNFLIETTICYFYVSGISL
ncbi:MAG: hypothetical protein KIG53_07520 [Oscillospiraceae bacterium]|nr:hypothetical protein [Oscillospiraceae bacterium]